MGQHAALRRDLEAGDQIVEQLQQLGDRGDGVGSRVDADHRVAAAVHQAVDDGGRDAGEVVGRVVGLQPHGHRARQADGVAEARDDAAFLRRQDQVLVAHDLADRGGDLRRDRGRELGQRLGRRALRQEVVAELAHRHGGDRLERLGIVRVEDQPRHLVVLVGDQRLGQDLLQGQVGQRHLGGDALLRRLRRDPRQPVARARRRRLRHQLLEVGEDVSGASDGVAVGHGPPPAQAVAVAAASPMRATSGVRPASTSANTSRSMLPPLSTSPTPLARHGAALLHQACQRRRARALGEVVGVLVVGADGGGDLVLGDAHDALSAGEHDGHRLGMGDAAGEPVGEGGGRVGRHQASRREGQRHGRRILRHHADDLGS